MKLNNEHLRNDFKNYEVEQIENKKQEYKLIGKFRRTPGLKLYCFNHVKNEIKEIKTSQKRTVKLDEALSPKGLASEEAKIDSRFEYFEALNMKNAEKKVQKFIDEKTKKLNNLKSPSKKTIDFYKK